MCFYAFSPDCSVKLTYVSEKIFPTLKKNEEDVWCGTSGIEVDLFVENEGTRTDLPSGRDNSIHRLYILYPNRLFKITNDNVEFDSDKIFYHQTFDFIYKFINSSFATLSDIEYKKDILSTKITYQYVDDVKITSIDEDKLKYNICLTTPDPNTLNIRYINGETDGNVSIKLAKQLPGISSQMLYEILKMLDMTIIECEFERPILKGKTRWIRFKISPYSTSRALPKSLKKILYETFLNANSYPFEIKGPYNVRYEFIQKIESYINILEHRLESINSSFSQKEIEEFNEHINRYKESLGKLEVILSKYHDSKCEDWRLEIFSNGGVISGIREYGIYKISGSLMNYVTFPDEKRHVVLTWKTGRENVCPKKDKIKAFCDNMLNTNGYNQCDCLESCYPFSGNFKIAYEWRKDSRLLQSIIIIGTIATFATLPITDIIKFIYNSPIAIVSMLLLALFIVVRYRNSIYNIILAVKNALLYKYSKSIN